MASMDLAPTILSLADPGGTLPAGLDGQDILPVLRGQKPPHEYLYWSFNDSRAVRAGDWKLILNPPNFPGEEVDAKVWLSNLEADPSERTNLAAKEPLPRAVALTITLVGGEDMTRVFALP